MTMDLDQAERLGIDRLERYQVNLTSLHRELVEAAAAGKYRRAGLAYGRICQLQADHGLLPDHEGYSILLAQLDAMPGKVLGLH